MRWGFVLANGVVLAGVAWITASATQTDVAGVLTTRPAAAALGDLGALEDAAVERPSAEVVAQLASAYLEREQPGLAAAAIDRAPDAIRARPEVAQVHVRVLLHEGRARDALAVARRAHGACEREACPAWLEAKTARELEFAEQIVAFGIEDPSANPAATQMAYERSTREVRLVAMR